MIEMLYDVYFTPNHHHMLSKNFRDTQLPIMGKISRKTRPFYNEFLFSDGGIYMADIGLEDWKEKEMKRNSHGEIQNKQLKKKDLFIIFPLLSSLLFYHDILVPQF